MGGLFGGFINPLLALGALAAALPLIIHLLNRQRHKPVRWAAMRFVQAAFKKTRRRVEMENWLLLLLRMAAVALLAFALARPFTGKDSPLAGLTESRRDVVLILDASASMGAREASTSTFDLARERARAIGRELKGQNGDRLRLILAGEQPRLLSWSTPEQALSLLETIEEPLDEALDLAASLGEVLKLAREAQTGGALGAVEIRLLTDAQKRNFMPDTQAADNQGARALFEVLDALAELDLRVIVEDLGPSERVPHNLGIEAVRPLGEVEGPGAPLEVEVSVRNFGDQPRGGVRVSLAVDGQRRPSKSVELPARGSATALFRVPIESAGEHLLEASIEADRLAADNTRAEVVRVPDALRVLLVDGNPAEDLSQSGTGYLLTVLEPARDDNPLSAELSAPFLPRVVRPEELSTLDLSLKDYDAIWLADVARVPPAAADALERFCASGGLLVISAGPELDIDHYNARFFRADGSGLLPAELLRAQLRDPRTQGHWRVAQFDSEHPALRFFADERFRLLFTEAPVYGMLGTRVLERSRTLASLDDANQSALLIERAYDRGRVMLWTSSIDARWTRIPRSPATLVPLTHEWLRYGARPTLTRRNLVPGEGLEIEVAGVFPRNLRLIKPNGSERALDGEPKALEGGRWKLPAIAGDETTRAGAYRVEREGAAPSYFAVQLDAREGDLERLSAEELGGVHRALVQKSPSAGTDDTQRSNERGEIWRALAIATLVCLVCESIFAAWIGRRRRMPA